MAHPRGRANGARSRSPLPERFRSRSGVRSPWATSVSGQDRRRESSSSPPRTRSAPTRSLPTLLALSSSSRDVVATRGRVLSAGSPAKLQSRTRRRLLLCASRNFEAVVGQLEKMLAGR